MTPAVEVARMSGISYRIHEYEHDPANEAYGAEAAQKLGAPEQRIFKTLVVNLDDREFVVGVIPVGAMLSMKAVAKALGGKRAKMADKADAERTTGYVLGGVSPLGQKKRLRTVIDSSAAQYPTIYVSAGRRGLDIELAAEDLRGLLRGSFAALCQGS
ncbi:MAG TPA: Cys-tRNA(Pro) deacylase [Pseudomonadales bacterium]|nr:Cys-tRNA(Pro) deacylase [Pseudomonadales bacterium]